MMLVHPDLDSVFHFAEDRVCTLVIENQDFFRSFLADLSDQISGTDGKTVLSIENCPVDLSGYGELIDSFLCFSLNRKPLINRIIARLEREAVCDHYLRTAELLSAVERLVMDLSDDLPCELVCKKLSVGNLLRGVGLELQEDGADPLEKLLDYMALVREFDREKLFFLVNLRSYYSDSKMELFLQSALGHGHNIMLIDSCDHPRLALERRVTVDRDLCEF